VGFARTRLLAVAAALGAFALSGCGNTLQDQAVPHNELEALVLAPYPVFWLGAHFHGMQITEAGPDTSGAFQVTYGNCLEGGQNTCVAPLEVITSADNSFVPGEGGPGRVYASLRGVGALISDGGRAIAIPTGPVVVNVYAHTAALACAAAQTAVPINFAGAPGAPLAAPLADTGYATRPLPAQIPPLIHRPER
jgi:predicted small secreted protein